MGYQTLDAIDRRRRNIRIILFVIILTTLPFYCAGALLWGTAPRRAATPTDILPSFTPIGADLTQTSTPTLTSTPLFVTLTQLSPLQPTPGQFFVPTRSITFTPFPTLFIPTSTLAPSLTPFPSTTPFPTNTPLPQPTNTPLPQPTDTPLPLPTDTPVPLPTDTPVPLPTDTLVPLPTDTPAPLLTDTPLPFPTDTPSGGG